METNKILLSNDIIFLSELFDVEKLYRENNHTEEKKKEFKVDYGKLIQSRVLTY